MHNHRTNPNHQDNPAHPPGGHGTLHFVLQVARDLPEFWSSDINRAAIDLLNPKPNDVLLDIGAGLGPATIEAAKRVVPTGQVIAVEPSRAMRGVLRLRSQWQSARRIIDVRSGAAESLPCDADTIDGAWAVNALHHFNDVERAAAELVRVLKPGGVVLFIDEDFNNTTHPHHEQMGVNDGSAVVNVEDVTKLLGVAGLHVVDSDQRVIAGVPGTVITATKQPT